MKLRWSPLIIDAPRRNDTAARQGQCLPVRRFLVAGPSNRGRSETRVAQIASGTPILRWGVGRRGGGAAAPRRLNAGRDFYFQNHSQVCISDVLSCDSCSGGLPAAPPAPLGDHCAGFLRSSGAESACRTQTRRPESRICCVFTVWPGQNRVPPANRTTWTPSGQIKHCRFGARDCNSSMVSAFSRPGAWNPRECCQFRERRLGICRKSPPRPRAGASNPRECCQS